MVVSPLGSRCEVCGLSLSPTSESPAGLLRHSGRWMCEQCLDEILSRTVMIGCIGRWSEELDSLRAEPEPVPLERACG